ncbi:MAG: hypothetical protein O2970_10400 [Proteobacteria bacterium]|nr:hypothetical protein [Pseudomonadota bacterium]MDA0967352.1 hypothetical protein [Pseudomonadota bacterium]
MKKILFFVVMCCFIHANASAGQELSCDKVETFYQTHQFDCIDKLLKALDKMDNPKLDPNRIQNQIGFLAAIFTSYPDKIDSILDKQVSKNSQSALIGALYRAGMLDEAAVYADKVDMATLLNSYKKSPLPLLNKTYSQYNPGDNDFLIGAFMATGDKSYIENVLHQYGEADDKIVRYALRIAAMQGKFGSTLLPAKRKEEYIKQHKELPLKALVNRERWKQNPKEMLQTLTMSSAFWALSSLTKEHKPIAETLTHFFGDDKRLNLIAREEANNFSNYIMLSIVMPAMAQSKSEEQKEFAQKVEIFLTDYENFKVVKPFDLKPKEKKQ